jgi:hypothetical protein
MSTTFTFIRLIVVASFILSACSAPVVKGTLFEGAKPTGAEATSLALKTEEAIVVLSGESTTKDEAWPTACVRDAIENADSNIRFMTPQAFRDATFPWFETHEVAEGIAELKDKPSLSNAVEQIGVRYIVSVVGKTGTVERDGWGGSGPGAGLYIGKHGFMFCGAGPGGGGCLGFLAWQRTSDVSAALWDFKRGILAAAIAAKVSGASAVPAFGLPVPLIAPTETGACRELGYQIARFVTTGIVPEVLEVDVPGYGSTAQ